MGPSLVAPAAPRRSSRPERLSAVGLTLHRFMAGPGVDLHQRKPVDCARATDAVALLGGGGISAQPLDDRVQVVCSAGHVDVDGVFGHGGDDIVVGAGNSRVGARVPLAPAVPLRIVHWSSGAVPTRLTTTW